MVTQIVFIILTIIVLGGALGAVSSRNLYYSALYLCVTLTGMAGYFVLLNAGFLAMVQIVVYIGAIAILILFAIMLSRKIMTSNEPAVNKQNWMAVITVPVLYVVLVYLVSGIAWPVSAAAPAGDVVLQIGLSLLNGYLIPFEVVSILLLVALIGAIILARDVTSTE